MALEGLRMVAEGEDKVIEGWLKYGAALNKGRSLCAGDREFGRWVEENVHWQVAIAPEPHDRLAAMWAACEPHNFSNTRRAHPRVRTVRGLQVESAIPKARFIDFVMARNLAPALPYTLSPTPPTVCPRIRFWSRDTTSAKINRSFILCRREWITCFSF